MGNSIAQSFNGGTGDYSSRMRNGQERPLPLQTVGDIEPDLSAIKAIPKVAIADPDALMRMEKASYQRGDFDKRDVTRKGDTLTSFFTANFGRSPSALELMQYGNYNNLSSTHDLSVNREIITPSIEVLARQGVSLDQAKDFLTRDAQFAEQRLARLAAQAEAQSPRLPLSERTFTVGSGNGINQDDVVFGSKDLLPPQNSKNNYIIDHLANRIVPADERYIVQPYEPPEQKSNVFGAVKGQIDQWTMNMAVWGARNPDSYLGKMAFVNGSFYGGANDAFMPNSSAEAALMLVGGEVMSWGLKGFILYSNTLPTLGRTVIFGKSGVSLGEHLLTTNVSAASIERATPFTNGLVESVSQEGRRLIADGEVQFRAVAGAGYEKLNIESPHYQNIYSGPQEFPGVQYIDRTTLVVKDPEAYMARLKDVYEQNGDVLHPRTAEAIWKRISDPTAQLRQGLPGTHAEVRAANWVYNEIDKIDSLAFNPWDLTVVTYRLMPGPGQGLPFIACQNCASILPPRHISLLEG